MRRIRSLRFEAFDETATGSNMAGTGVVAVTEPADGVIVFEEAGAWQPASDGPPLEFTNVYRWSTKGDLLGLEHLRFGPDHPVFLVDMALGPDGVWREITPHQCGKDCYRATLTVDDRRILLAWSIRGPRKNMSLHRTYV